MATIISEAERAAFLWMQGRMVELLLRHDVRRFRGTFVELSADPEAMGDPLLARYRALAVLFHLREELFDAILPAIKRRLSFEAPREVRREEPPTRGRIDWSRTAAASWGERPGEVPLELYTRQRRRHFTTPENLLTVVTLLEYRHAAQTLLDEEVTREGASALRHPLHDLGESCTRELAFPQFAGLVRECEAIVSGDAPLTAGALEQAVEEHLQPGHNSAYDELLAWRRQLRTLRLLERTQQLEPQPMLGARPERDNYLYQLWLFYELGEFLQRQGLVESWDTERMTLTFRWGEGEEARDYVLSHDQSIPNGTQWGGLAKPVGVRPDFYLRHLKPVTVERPNDGSLIWREPGFVLDAKYYRPRDDEEEKAPSSTIKRMIADLHLMGEKHGALLFAFHGRGSEAGAAEAPERFAPLLARAQATPPDVHLDIWRMQPHPVAESTPPLPLRKLLDHLHVQLRERAVVRCHGVFLDPLSATAHGELAEPSALPDRAGAALGGTAETLLLCPKPHVGAWRVDVVRHEQCCEDPTVCHIIGQPGIRPPQRLTRLEEITEALKGVVGGEGDEAAQVATKQALVIAKRYADLIQPDIQEYKQWIRDELYVKNLFDSTPLLTDAQRETLALARFLWEQIDRIKARNYAGPTLLLTGVLEEVTRGTIYLHSGILRDANGKKLQQTLGTLGNSKRYGGGDNWRHLETRIARAGHWQAAGAHGPTLPFSDWIDKLERIAPIRNQAAHEAHVDAGRFRALQDDYFGVPGLRLGTLNGLLLAWKP